MHDLPRVIGHRGAAAEAPENTLAGIRQAWSSGARWVEVDVKLTRDGVPVLFHYDRLERTTDGEGPLLERSLAELRRLDAGGGFHHLFAGERVPTLDEALDLCLELGLGINLELKPCPGRERETAEVALDHLARRWPATAPPPLISSFSEVSVEVAREVIPGWPRGCLFGRPPPDWLERAERLACTTVNLGWRRLTRADVERVRAAGFPVLIYTVNDVERARRLFEWGADAVFTDTVRSLVEAGLDAPARLDAPAGLTAPAAPGPGLESQ